MASTQIRAAQILNGAITNTQINASAAIATTKLADGALFIKSDGSVAMGAALAMGSNKITGLATPTLSTDAATKAYVDAITLGLSVKLSVRCATTANLSSSSYTGGVLTIGSGNTTIDSVAINVGDRILVKNQSTQTQNGIYVVTNATTITLTRASDYNTSAEASSGSYCFVEEGGQAAEGWLMTTAGPITLDTSNLVWVQFNAGVAYSQGNGISISGSTISAVANTAQGINVTSSGIGITLDGSTLSQSSSGIKVGTTVVLQSSHVFLETPGGTLNGTNTTFTLANTPVSGTVCVFLNGMLQTSGAGNDYTISGGTITMLTAPLSTDDLLVNYLK